MKRSFALSLIVALTLAGGLALFSRSVRAGARGGGDANDQEEVERRVEVVRLGGGAFLGVGLEDLEDGARGARVRSVEPESAAAEAGIEKGDVITRFDGESVRSARQLARLVRETPVGRAVPVEVTRDGDTRTLTATLDKASHPFHLGDEGVVVPDLGDLDRDPDVLPAFPHATGPRVFQWRGPHAPDFSMAWGPRRPRLGIRYLEIEGQLAEYFGLSGDEGVLVSSVEEGTPAAGAGIRAGDVLLELDGKPVRSGRDLRRAVAAAEDGQPAAVTLLRHGKTVETEVVLPEPEEPQTLPRREAGVSL